MSTITKAIIATAGWGTRRLPITKSIEKAMLPVANRPLVDYVVQDCIAAGIRDIYLVVNEGNSQVRSFYSDNARLNAYLSGNSQDEILRSLAVPQVNF
ncbi:MAG: UTP--glucose-1-phosphate uridylyltransferase, partial [bacterium]|nr:UTP--glucose-1-phosphate uridylyltransferase [bacterium]